ncbi:MAG: TetR/AcrR family transcriptional regulator [Pseudonocardia sediminis]
MAEFQPLPAGRHGLTRDEVRRSQRARLLRGMAEAVAEDGYPAATVAGVLKRVHVSRQTFYEHFTDKQDCFLAVLDESARGLAAALRDGVAAGGAGGEPVRPDRMVAAYLAAITEQPTFARVFFLESAAAGLPAQRKRVEVQNLFTELMIETFRGTPYWHTSPDPEFACRILVGGVSSLVTAALVADGTGPPPDTAARIVALVEQLFGTQGRAR